MRLYHIISFFDDDCYIRVINGCSIACKGKLGNLFFNSKFNQLSHTRIHSININIIDHSVDVYLLNGDTNA